MSELKKTKFWSGTAAVITIVSFGMSGLLAGVNRYLRDYRAVKIVATDHDGNQSIIGPVRVNDPSDSKEQKQVFGQGVKAIQMMDWKEARVHFGDYQTRLSGKRSLAFYFMGFADKRAGNIEGAEKNFRSYLERAATKKTAYRVPAVTELIYTMCRYDRVEKLEEALELAKKYQIEADDAIVEYRTGFANGYWQAVNQLALLKGQDLFAATEVREHFFEKIAGIDGTSDPKFLRSYFKDARILTQNELLKEAPNLALKLWKNLKLKEKYLSRITDEAERREFLKLKKKMEGLEGLCKFFRSKFRQGVDLAAA